MRILLILLFSITISYSQFPGLVYEDPPVNNNEHFMFSLSSDTIINGSWTQMANYPLSLFGVNAMYIEETGKIFTCGGSSLSGEPTKACYFFDPAANTFTPADSLPDARWSGKLVRVKDSLYLIGSVSSNFFSPDGKIYKYSIQQNQWAAKSEMPLPRLHESAVFVYNDTLIVCVGGSSNGFSNPSNKVRVYNPVKDTWLEISAFPVSITTAHAEYSGEDASAVLIGGNMPAYNNIIYRGTVTFVPGSNDSLAIVWAAAALNDSTLFKTGVYRVGGANAGNWMLFGPASYNYSIYNSVYALHFDSTEVMQWYRMVPGIPDSAGNRPTIASIVNNDSGHIFLFGGSIGGDSVVQNVYKYSYAVPVPIGINPVSGIVPEKFLLHQNYPNPFNPSTKIKFSVPKVHSSNVKLVVYDVLGREVETLVNEFLKPGTYEVTWLAKDGISSGIYFYTLFSGEYKASKKMLMIK